MSEEVDAARPAFEDGVAAVHQLRVEKRVEGVDLGAAFFTPLHQQREVKVDHLTPDQITHQTEQEPPEIRPTTLLKKETTR